MLEQEFLGRVTTALANRSKKKKRPRQQQEQTESVPSGSSTGGASGPAVPAIREETSIFGDVGVYVPAGADEAEAPAAQDSGVSKDAAESGAYFSGLRVVSKREREMERQEEGGGEDDEDEAGEEDGGGAEGAKAAGGEGAAATGVPRKGKIGKIMKTVEALARKADKMAARSDVTKDSKGGISLASAGDDYGEAHDFDFGGDFDGPVGKSKSSGTDANPPKKGKTL